LGFFEFLFSLKSISYEREIHEKSYYSTDPFSERMLNFYLKLSESNIQGNALFKGTPSLVFGCQKKD